MLLAILAQATESNDPDLTVPTVTIAVCAVVVVVALVLGRRRRRATEPGAPADTAEGVGPPQ